MADDAKLLRILDLIFDGKPFTGKTLGELHGILEAKVEALAKIVKSIIEERK